MLQVVAAVFDVALLDGWVVDDMIAEREPRPCYSF
jgi:hypothetical protein